MLFLIYYSFFFHIKLFSLFDKDIFTDFDMFFIGSFIEFSLAKFTFLEANRFLIEHRFLFRRLLSLVKSRRNLIIYFLWSFSLRNKGLPEIFILSLILLSIRLFNRTFLALVSFLSLSLVFSTFYIFFPFSDMQFLLKQL